MAFSLQRRLVVLIGIFLFAFSWYRFNHTFHPKQFSSDVVSNVDSNSKPHFIPGSAKEASEFYTKTIVMAKLKGDDISWVDNDLQGFNTSIYTVDDTSAGGPTVPQNKGREAMVYLSYIIDNYDSLPDVVLFFHPHRVTWHNNILLDLDSAKTISRLNPAHVTRQGYFNSRCHHDPGCPDWLHIDRPEAEWDMVKKFEEQYFTSQVWRELHPSDPIPTALSQPCCAQFAVSRARIRARPRSHYEHYRQWLLDTPTEDKYSGRIMEYNWQYIFTGQSEFCPSQHKCYCDGYGICFGGTTDENLLAWLKLLREREVLDEKLDEARKDEKEDNKDKIGEMEGQKASIVARLEELKREAYTRGESPRERAKECGRAWKDGDGF